MTKERKARWLARQSQESLDRIRAVDAALIEDASKPKLQLNLKLAEKETQPLIVAASKDKLPIKLKFAVKIYIKTSGVEGKLLNNEKYFTRNVVYQEVF
ncbi:hypothetical protein AVEN_162826-1 [Araneus ventricosus]|uniref:Uncharacterized protein n=1 Tax=Araneus ventricosus TaxID=182803 RepID=A0A4Y2C6Z6_ARAVE|nr:hypothetical protein AVEN_162826-1 [Araneus ventricosus]